MTNITNMCNAALVDELGAIAAQKAELAKREKAIKGLLDKRTGKPSNYLWEGVAYQLRKSTSIRSILDTAAVKSMLGAKTPMKTSASSSWRVDARVAEAA